VKFDPETGFFTLFRPDPLVSDNQIANSVYTILEDRFGNFWIGTLGGGLSEFNRSTKKFRTFRNNPTDSTSLSHNSVISLHEDQFGFFWVGTYGGGLNRMDRKSGRFINYTARNGLPDDIIFSIEEDPGGNLWMSTNTGLVKFDTKSKNFRNYDVLDGLQSNEFTIGASLRCKDGEMFFGGISGFNLFYPDSIQENNFIPPTVITQFKVMDKEVNPGEGIIELEYNQNYVTFEFSSLSYALIEKNQYALANKNYVQIINDRNLTRLEQLLDKNKIAFGGAINHTDRTISPTILKEVSFDDAIMQEEIFGPILPVLSYKQFDTVLDYIQDHEKPLSAYLFSNDKTEQAAWLGQLSFGGGCINDAIMHITNPNLPFGGVGQSGNGSYHGKAGFDTFSHRKSVFEKPRLFEVPLKYPPYTAAKMNWIKRLLKFS
jgi:hypothetical protein